MNYNTEKSIKALVCSIPLAGHYTPIVRIAQALAKQPEFQIIFATSSYRHPNIKFQTNQIKRLDLIDQVNLLSQWQWQHLPLYYFQKQWYGQLRQFVIRQKPNIVICDFFSTALLKVAKQMNITTVIHFPTNLQFVNILNFPILNKNFSFFGISFLYNSISKYFLTRQERQMFECGQYYDRALVLVSSFYGFNDAISLPPNFKMIGNTISARSGKQEIEEELSSWLLEMNKNNKNIVYVTFGSFVILQQQYLNFLYEGLKKINVAVIWSLRKGQLPENNKFFFVRKWLPQEQILGLKEVKVVITHCGWGGVMECIQARKPMLCVPVFADQTFNVNLVQKKGIGIALRKVKQNFNFTPVNLIKPDFTHQKLIQSIGKLINEQSFIANLNKLNDLSDETGGIQEAVRLIKNAAKNGIQHLIDKDVAKIRKRSIIPLCLVSLALIGTVLCCGKYFSNKLNK